MEIQNKIPCNSERLGLLNPQMIQAVSDASAFQIGHQYVTEKRVRIVEADDVQISSAVIGNSSLYKQTIRLKDEHLILKCSCMLMEAPMCRHCIAVLLEYHRWVQPRQSRKTNDSRETEAQPQANHAADVRTLTMHASPPDVKLSEVMQFVEWLQPAMKAIEKGEQVPEPPKLDAGEVFMWIQTIRNLEDQRRESEEVQVNLESEMRDREAYVERLTHQLQVSIAEAKTTQATHKEKLDKVDKLASEVARCRGK